MVINANEKSFFIFDLDDTLYNEIDFLKSGYSCIAKILEPYLEYSIFDLMFDKYKNNENVFAWIIQEYSPITPFKTIYELLDIYRTHFPTIKMSQETIKFLGDIKEKNISTGLITDGRSTTQRNKLKALGIENYFTDIIISEEFGTEKPNKLNYLYFQKKHPEKSFYFFGDNTSKDFIVPSKLGWNIICIKDAGKNIHLQELHKLNFPNTIISSFEEITLL
ncbi:MAG: family hydrolase [Mucilaginibacter sp.]|nr:family hydrolase [Mucilaginibacter sp.]